jgi:hypothetical protein
MATHRGIPGANLPESGPSSTRKNRGDVGQGLGASPSVSGLGNTIPGESGLGSSLGGGLGVGSDAFGTTGASPVISDDSSTFGVPPARGFPRASRVMDQVKQQANSRVNEQKARAAEGLGTVASAIRQASEHLRTENQTLASYADTAVDQIQLFADRMRDKEPAEMIDDLERFARRNPTAFIGGAFLLGIGLARFLKSSETRAVDSSDGYGGRRLAGSRPLSGEVGYTSGDLAWSDDMSQPSRQTNDPAPDIAR